MTNLIDKILAKAKFWDAYAEKFNSLIVLQENGCWFLTTAPTSKGYSQDMARKGRYVNVIAKRSECKKGHDITSAPIKISKGVRYRYYLKYETLAKRKYRSTARAKKIQNEYRRTYYLKNKEAIIAKQRIYREQLQKLGE